MSAGLNGTPVYLDLRTLADAASCSIRWLRSRLVDPADPLPHFKVQGKVLVKRDEFDRWMERHRIVQPENSIDDLVNSVVAGVFHPRQVA